MPEFVSNRPRINPAQQAHVTGGLGAPRQTAVGGNQRTIEHLGEGDIGGVVIRDPAKRGEPQRGIGADQCRRYNFQWNGKKIGQRVSGLFERWPRAPEEKDVANLVVKKRWDDDLGSPLHMLDEQGLRRRNVIFG